MNKALVKSVLRHLLGAILAALGVILATPANLNAKTALITLGAAAVPVLVKAVDPGEAAFGVGSAPAVPVGD